jgi:hypothetical protein
MPVSMSHTSVPRWTAEFIAPATAVRVVVIAAEHTDVVARILASLGCDTALVPPASVADVLSTACVGWHFVIVGSEGLVGSVRAQLLAAGAIDAEVTAVLDDSEQRRIYCTHCGRVTSAPAVVGAELDCGGCGAPLVVYYHFSRRLGAYMGYRVDSEDLR